MKLCPFLICLFLSFSSFAIQSSLNKQEINDLSGNLNVFLPDNNNINLTGGYKINRYDLSNQLLDSKLTDNHGMANWTAIIEGGYFFERYNTSLNTLWGSDLFEGRKQITVIGGITDTVTLVRSEPYIESVIVNGTVFGPGSTVHADVTVINPSTVAKNCKATIRIDMDKQLSYDFESAFQNSSSIQPGQKSVFGFDWTIPIDATPGTYSIASCIQTLIDNSWKLTGATNWDASIKMENSTISQIQWSGLTWNVKNGSGLGPGPNDWLANSSSVWVDEEDNLHLKIRKIGTKWYCASINTKPLYGYGNYAFQVTSNVENMDENVVLGLFTYENDTREIDIEFSKWGNPLEKTGWYNVQPSGPTSHHTFELPKKDNFSTHKFQWSPSKVLFQSYHGHSDYLIEKDSLISEWTYTGSQIPPAGNERIILNLWLFKGVPPSDMKESEVVIKSFSFSKVGDLSIQLENLDQTSSPLPGANGIVQLYNGENKLVSTKESDQNGTVIFNGLAVGNGYYYRVYYQPNAPASLKVKEYWGSNSGIQIIENHVTSSVFVRNKPVNGSISVFNSTKEVTGQLVEPGIPLRIEQTVLNPSSMEARAKGIIRLDRDSVEPCDFYLEDTSFVSIPAYGSITRTWTIIPIQKGSYYGNGTVLTMLDKDTITSDATTWSHLPLFRVSAPVADFSMNKTTGCPPLFVDFNDQTTSFPSSWAWDLNNDGTVDDTTQHPSYTFMNVGTYSVKLIVANKAGTDSIIQTITVYPALLPTIEINVSPSEKVGEGTLVTFTAISINGGTHPSYEWKVDGIVKGNNSLVFTTNELTNKQQVSCSLISDAPCATPGKVFSNVMVMEVTPVNKIPFAIAGTDQSVNERTLVTLDGTASFDLDNQPLNYLWRAPKNIVLNKPTSPQPSFTAPEVTKDSTLIFTLTVNDGLANSQESSVNIYVKNVSNTPAIFIDKDRLKIYPNPTKGIIFIEGLNALTNTEISIYTNDGHLIGKKVNHSATCAIDLSKEMPGTYLLMINRQKIKIIRE